MIKNLLIAAFCLLGIFSKGQQISLVTAADLPGCQVTRNDTFTGEGLFGYLDGGADLYLEYGFTKLYVDEFLCGKDKITLEVYVMSDAPAAFGIYSVSVSRCMMWNTYASFSCATPYQISAVSGRLYINAMNPSGKQEGMGICDLIVKTVIARNPQETWFAPPMFQQQKLSPFLNTLRFFRGPISINNGIPGWANLFSGIGGDVYTLKIQNQSFSGIIARITFDRDNSMEVFRINAGLNAPGSQLTPVMTGAGIYRSWYKINGTKILFLEGSSATVKITDFVPVSPDIPELQY
jgi:hypothetical protein